jgi:Poly(ADP-ribose) polymerase and DNA-Ligase Zn-finger region
MASKIEVASTGRARCRACKEAIGKGELRFAEEFQNPYSEDGGTSFRYWHLACAAKGMANELAPALAAYDGPIDEAVRTETQAIMTANLRPEMPHAEVASSGRARCRACDEAIKKGEWRIAFERIVETPMGPQKGAAYTHTACLGRYVAREQERGHEAVDREETIRKVLANSRLGEADRERVERDMRA